MSSDNLKALCWPCDQLDMAVQALARHTGIGTGTANTPPSPGADSSIDRRLEQSAQTAGLEAEAVSSSYGELPHLLTGAAPALMRLDFGGRDYFLALCGGGRRRLQLLSPTLALVKICKQRVIAQLAGALERPRREEITQLLDSAGIAPRRRAKATHALLRERLAGHRIERCWLLRQPPGRATWQQVRHKGLHWQFAGLITCHASQVGLLLLSWWIIGRAILSGNIDPGWLAAWVLTLITQIPLALLTTRLQGGVSVTVGTLLKRRLLDSALRIEPDKIRHMGSGQVLSRVYDAENIEADALHGSFLLVLAAVELVVAVPVLAATTGGPFLLFALLLFLLFAFSLCRSQYRLRTQWTGERLSLTHRLIEKMAGHRTRLVQQPPADWHRGEDRELNRYLDKSAAVDESLTRLIALLPRTWLLLGIAGLAPAFVSGSANSAQIAVGVGGVLLGYRAVLKAMYGFSDALDALVSWRKVRELFQQEAPAAREAGAAPNPQAPAAQPLCTLHKLRFRYPQQEKPVLADCSLSIHSGERLLLQGASGSGKSTLANLITGIQQPDDGLLLLQGYDRASIGEDQWRRLVASAPQFHENHVIAESFLFNLLMGDQWPPTDDGLRRAYTICDELGLTPLLERMPAGMLQTVGEMGWQLSHGEKSRLFIARALLQNAELVVLDESFAALDPQNLKKAVACVQKHAKTLLVIAHP